MIAVSIADNLLTAPVIAFLVALIATSVQFEVRLPESLYPILSTYLLLAIGIKGGKALHSSSLTDIWKPLLAALALGVLTPTIAFVAFRMLGRLDKINAAALAAHYGSVSAVTFTVAMSTLESRSIDVEGFVAGLLAVLEVVGIIVALFLARGRGSQEGLKEGLLEVVRGRSIALLLAGLIIGTVVGPDRLEPTNALFTGLFTGALTLFLIEMGAIAAQQLRDVRAAGIKVIVLGIVVPLVNGCLGATLGSIAGLSTGGTTILAVLAASASYIAAPAAVRIALPGASPGIYITASLGITFPFNLTVGIPLYIALAQALT